MSRLVWFIQPKLNSDEREFPLMQEKNVELIAPAGDMTGLLTALKAGADAVYFGAEEYNMRAGSSNFTPSDFSALKTLCEEYHAKGYLALQLKP